MSSETQINTIGFRLGTEELLYVLKALELKTLPSLGPNPLESVSAERKQQVLAAGFNSLRARDWVKLSTDPQHPIIMDNLFISSLLICASARKMMSLTKQGQNRPAEQIFLFQTPDVLVTHHLVEPGVHEFIMTSDREQLIKGMLEFLGLGNVPAPQKQSGFTLPADTVQNVMKAISSRDLPQIEKTLNQVKAARPFSQSVLDCLKGLQSTTVIMLADFPEKMISADQVKGKTISILNSEKLAWQIENNAQNDLLFSQISAIEAEQLVTGWVGSLANSPT